MQQELDIEQRERYMSRRTIDIEPLAHDELLQEDCMSKELYKNQMTNHGSLQLVLCRPELAHGIERPMRQFAIQLGRGIVELEHVVVQRQGAELQEQHRWQLERDKMRCVRQVHYNWSLERGTIGPERDVLRQVRGAQELALEQELYIYAMAQMPPYNHRSSTMHCTLVLMVRCMKRRVLNNDDHQNCCHHC